MTIDDPVVQQRIQDSMTASMAEAETLDNEAMKQADVGVMATQPRRRPGRPPGSKNQSTIARESQMVSHLTIPRGSRAGTTTDPTYGSTGESEQDRQRRLERERQARKNKAQAYETMISIELNDYIMKALVGMGVPGELVYAPGQAPAEQQHYKKYGPIGNAMAVDPAMAKSLGQFLADLASTDTGSKVANVTDNPAAGMVLHGVVAFFSTYQWMKNFQAMMPQIQMVIQRHQQAMQDAARAAQQNGDGNGGQ